MREKLNYYQLSDEEGLYEIVATSLSQEELERLIKEYKETDEYYTSEGLIKFLKSRGIEAFLIAPKKVYF